MGDERCSRSRSRSHSKSRSRSRSLNSKSRRNSKSPKAVKKRGRPRTRPIISPSKKKKVGRPKRKVEVATPNISSIHSHADFDLNLKMPKTSSRKKMNDDKDSETDVIFDPTSRVLKNQSEIETARSQCKMPDPTTMMAHYKSRKNIPQESDKTATENSFDVARLMFLSPIDYFQGTFQGQEFVRLSIKRNLIKHLVEISWSLIQSSQLHYNIVNPYWPKFNGIISIDEEFRSFMQLENYVDEDKKAINEQEYENAFYNNQEMSCDYHAPDDIDDAFFDDLLTEILPESKYDAIEIFD